MGLFDFLSRSVVRRAEGTRNTLFQYVNNNAPVYPAEGLPTYIHAYTHNASVYSIVSLIARRFSVISWYNFQIIDEKKTKEYKSLQKQLHRPGFLNSAAKLKKAAYQEQDDKSKLAQLINHPNAYQGQDSFLFGNAVYYFLCGETFIWQNKGKTEEELNRMTEKEIALLEVLELFILPPQYMEIIPDPNDVYGVLGYQMLIDGQYVKYRKSEIIHWKMFNPVWDGGIARSHLRGFAPLAAGIKVLTQDQDAIDASVAMYQNGGVKAIIYQEDGPKLTPVQSSQLDEVIAEKVNNPKRKAAVAALQGRWGLLQVGNTSVDMELLEAQEATLIKLCNLWGVPPELFIKNNTYENKNQARKDLLTSLLIPACCSLRDELNRVLIPAFGNKRNQTLDIDYGDIPELQQDLKYLVDSLVSAWWFTPNQRLKMMNEEENKDPNMNKIYIPSSLVPLEDANMEAETEELNKIGMNDYAREDRADSMAKVS